MPEEIRGEHQDKVHKECEEYLKDSRRLWDIAALGSKGRTKTGQINPTPISKKALNKKDRPKRKQITPAEEGLKITGIDETEIQRRKETGECLCCAWPSDRKGAHSVKDRCRPIKLDIRTCSYPKNKYYQRQETLDTSEDSASTDMEDS